MFGLFEREMTLNFTEKLSSHRAEIYHSPCYNDQPTEDFEEHYHCNFRETYQRTNITYSDGEFRILVNVNAG